MNIPSLSTLLVITLLLSGCGEKVASERCSAWEYAFLELDTYVEVKDYAVNDFKYLVGWHGPAGRVTWWDGELQDGDTDLNLLEFFGASSASGPDMLNALGARGWETFAVKVVRPTWDSDETDSYEDVTEWDYHLRRCSA